jgi:competence protein ComEA
MRKYPRPSALLLVAAIALLPSAVMSQTDSSQVPATQPAAQPAAPASPAAAPLPDGPGRDTLIQLCSQCHSPNIVSGEYHTREEWLTIIATMANGTDKQNEQIADYLTTAFPSAASTTPKQ